MSLFYCDCISKNFSYNITMNIFFIHIVIFKTPNWEKKMRALGNVADMQYR